MRRTACAADDCRRLAVRVGCTMVDSVSPALARRIALAAQGFGRPLPEASGTRQLAAVVDRLGLLQIDSVNVFERSHYLPVFAAARRLRQGAARPAHDSAAAGAYVEYWAHEASFIPRRALAAVRVPACEEYRRAATPSGAAGLADEPADRSTGCAPSSPRTARCRRAPSSTTPTSAAGRGGAGPTSSAASSACSARARSSASGGARFERVYALPEQVLPRPSCSTRAPSRGRRACASSCERAAAAHGIAHRSRPRRLLPPASARRCATRSPTSTRRATSSPSTVPGWSVGGRPPYLAAPRRPSPAPHRDRGAAVAVRPGGVGPRRAPSECSASTTASRSTRPSPKRKFGYYTLPVLVDDDARRPRRPQERPAGRRAARAVGVARAGRARRRSAARLVPVLRRAAAWQGLDEHRGRRPGRPGSGAASELRSSAPDELRSSAA